LRVRGFYQGLEQLEKMIEENSKGRKNADAGFESLVKDEFEALRKDLQSEVVERKVEDEAIIEALNRYTENLQSSLSVISGLEE